MYEEKNTIKKKRQKELQKIKVKRMNEQNKKE